MEQDEDSIGSWDSQAKYQDEYNTPAPIVTEEGADLSDYRMTSADHTIRSIYGYHPHRNNGTHTLMEMWPKMQLRSATGGASEISPLGGMMCLKAT